VAVYTKIIEQDIGHLFQEYDGIEQLNGITEGVENTNYLVETNNQKKFIFTIFEKRTNETDLPFFHKAMNEFNQNGITCPTPIIINKNDIFKIKKKSCAIYSFIEGRQITTLNNEALISLSKNISAIHNIGSQSNLFRENNMLLTSWKFIINKFKNYDGKNKIEFAHINNLILSLENQFPKNLKKSLIHGDLFKDNIFFKNNEVSGFIDFFFTCTDTIVYDLATLINAWFFNYEKFDENNFKIFFNEYFNSITWSNEEKENFNFYLKASAIRFFLTRIHDQYFNNEGEVNHKDPLAFFEILQFHEKNNLQDFF
jgi:homoserine kinase type II